MNELDESVGWDDEDDEDDAYDDEDSGSGKGFLTLPRILGGCGCLGLLFVLAVGGAAWFLVLAPDAPYSDLVDLDDVLSTESTAAKKGAPALADAELPDAPEVVEVEAAEDATEAPAEAPSDDGWVDFAEPEAEPEDATPERAFLEPPSQLEETRREPEPEPTPARADTSADDREAERAAERERRREDEAREREETRERDREREREREDAREREREREPTPTPAEPEPEPTPREVAAPDPEVEPATPAPHLKLDARLVDGPPRIKVRLIGDVLCAYEIRIELDRKGPSGNSMGETKRLGCPVSEGVEGVCEMSVKPAWVAGGAEIEVRASAPKHRSCPDDAPVPSRVVRRYP
jgi:hypothetical protein